MVEKGAAGQSFTALALFIVGASGAGELIARIPRSKHALANITEMRRIERLGRRKPRQPGELPTGILKAFSRAKGDL
jgi:hypothetical protein